MKGVRELALSFVLVLAFASVACAATLININTADEAALETLNGIGATKAQAIIDYRTQYGSFASIDQIQNVSGIGPATYNEIKDFIIVSGGSSDTNSQGQTAEQTTDQTTDASSSDKDTQTQSNASHIIVNSYVAPPSPAIYADAGDDRTVIVGADTEFDASAYDKNDQLITDPVRFSWNFGDGGTAEGPVVLHHFSYPGRYDVILSIAENLSAGRDEIIVTAEPAALSFTLLPDGGIAIANLAGHDLDLSGWIVKQSASAYASQFILPPHSKILSGAAMQISSATLGFKAVHESALEYPNGVVVLGMGQASTSTTAIKNPAPAVVTTTAPNPITVIHAAKTPVPKAVSVKSVAATSSQTAAAATSGAPFFSLYWAGAIALSLLAGIGTYFLRQPVQNETGDQTEIRDWRIIEETPEVD